VAANGAQKSKIICPLLWILICLRLARLCSLLLCICF